MGLHLTSAAFCEAVNGKSLPRNLASGLRAQVKHQICDISGSDEGPEGRFACIPIPDRFDVHASRLGFSRDDCIDPFAFHTAGTNGISPDAELAQL